MSFTYLSFVVQRGMKRWPPLARLTVARRSRDGLQGFGRCTTDDQRTLAL